jgi:hypothetical protein
MESPMNGWHTGSPTEGYNMGSPANRQHTSTPTQGYNAGSLANASIWVHPQMGSIWVQGTIHPKTGSIQVHLRIGRI